MSDPVFGGCAKMRASNAELCIVVNMALFPHVDFDLSFSKTGVRSGERNEGTLAVKVPKGGVERVEHIHFQLTSQAYMVTGMSGSTRTLEHTFDVVSLQIQIPERHRPPGVPKDVALTLPEGDHVFPLVFDLSDTVPANMHGPAWSFETRATVRLSVDWAIDPQAVYRLEVVQKRATHERTPAVLRSPPDFYKDEVFEVALTSSVVRKGEPLTGQITLRSSSIDHDYVVAIALRNFLHFKMNQGEERSPEPGIDVRFEKSALISGSPLSFSLPTAAHIAHTLNDAIDITAFLRVQIIRPWIGFCGAFEIPVVIA
jgi:hypothetical protein